MHYIFDNYDILDIDYVHLFGNIVQLEREKEIVEKIIGSISQKMPCDLYRRIENEIYNTNFIINDPTIYY